MNKGHPRQVINEDLVFWKDDYMLQVDLNADDLLTKLNYHDSFLPLCVPNYQFSLTCPLCSSLLFRETSNSRLTFLLLLQSIHFRVTFVIWILLIACQVIFFSFFAVLSWTKAYIREHCLQDQCYDIACKLHLYQHDSLLNWLAFFLFTTGYFALVPWLRQLSISMIILSAIFLFEPLGWLIHLEQWIDLENGEASSCICNDQAGAVLVERAVSYFIFSFDFVESTNRMWCRHWWNHLAYAVASRVIRLAWIAGWLLPAKWQTCQVLICLRSAIVAILKVVCEIWCHTRHRLRVYWDKQVILVAARWCNRLLFFDLPTSKAWEALIWVGQLWITLFLLRRTFSSLHQVFPKKY